MKSIIKSINKKINHIAWTFASTGIFLLILGILIFWAEFLLRFLVVIIIIAFSYVFFYLAYKTWSFKKDIEKFLKIK